MKKQTALKKVKVIGAGLAGCEAAVFLANKGIKVELYEMRPIVKTPAHKTENFAELVCSNSLKSNSLENASGLLKEELRRLGSFLLKVSKNCSLPGGKALVVDRNAFCKFATESVLKNPNISVKKEEVRCIEDNNPVIVATGPLTSDAMMNEIKRMVGEEFLFFFDAIAPIVDGETINMKKVFFADRYGRGEGDYLNCPMNREEFDIFYDELMRADTVNEREFEKISFFEGCLPIEEIARRGKDALRFGPMRPVGIFSPSDEKYYAVVQLRRENMKCESFNIVGFQTRLKHKAQEKIISLIPGLENAKILRYGAMHKNCYINSPALLDKYLRLKKNPNIFFAGQITGSEGYVEAMATGLYAAMNCHRQLLGKEMVEFSTATAIGALIDYITNPKNSDSFQPMNINFGLIEMPEIRYHKRRRRNEVAKKSLAEIDEKMKLLD
ncbi:MAG: methylenetetrahydrofolate--tRNA-(uracil(54)-C(5))-methyltransferase (FADH(2)-oxidizing) TrmFO [Candidatus Schekmanbacteria bacterium]|nr:MAG: methylenetetrahydrofolate--tRNA-(uracil(54)-C(5))-methyltransferase (FADH(2)-oxidizing) TrmFO [Candidatus Schekmanbacteria bacterium]